MGEGRIRLNVSALVGEGVVGKFLVVVDQQQSMEDLLSKMQKTLQRGGIQSTVERVLNGSKSTLPMGELVGDMLRDGEEVFAVLRGEGGQLLGKAKSYAADVDAEAQGGGYGGGAIPGPAEDFVDDDWDPDQDPDAPPIGSGDPDYPPPPHFPRGAPAGTNPIPGPCEVFEEERFPVEQLQTNHPVDPVPLTSYDNDWLVESLTPKLREFLLSKFDEALITEPKYVPSIGKFVGARFHGRCGSFISVFMRPQTAVGSDPASTLPVHYNVAKVDVLRFQQDVERNVQMVQKHVDHLQATLHALKSLLAKGMSESDHINVMLPYEYRTWGEVEGLMHEAEQPIFPQLDGEFPIIIVDTSGPKMAHKLTFVKAALKRALFAHITQKRGFNLIKFAPQGTARSFAADLTRPTQQALQEAEDWIEGLQPVAVSYLMDGFRLALAHQGADTVYLLSAGDGTDSEQHASVLHGVRKLNTREVGIHTVGVDCDPVSELLLRNISEANHGDFNLKSFGSSAKSSISAQDQKWSSWRTDLVNKKSKQMSDTFKKQRLSIGGQMRIVEVMVREEEKKESFWKEEWKAAQRLILASENQGPVPDQDSMKEIQRKMARSVSVRVGGGYLFKQTGDDKKNGLETFFEHKSSVPWSANSDAVALGPKFAPSLMQSDDTRMAKLPPTREVTLTESVLPPPERRRGGGSHGAKARNVPAPPNPWDRPSSAATMRPARPGDGGAPYATGANRGRKPQSARNRVVSADRAAGGGSRNRSTTPTRKQRSGQTPRGKQGGRPPSKPPPVAPAGGGGPPMPTLERRWSF